LASVKSLPRKSRPTSRHLEKSCRRMSLPDRRTALASRLRRRRANIARFWHDAAHIRGAYITWSGYVHRPCQTLSAPHPSRWSAGSLTGPAPATVALSLAPPLIHVSAP
jgi:hypothetical protein